MVANRYLSVAADNHAPVQRKDNRNKHLLVDAFNINRNHIFSPTK